MNGAIGDDPWDAGKSQTSCDEHPCVLQRSGSFGLDCTSVMMWISMEESAAFPTRQFAPEATRQHKIFDDSFGILLPATGRNC
jgi:hypothetical protein